MLQETQRKREGSYNTEERGAAQGRPAPDCCSLGSLPGWALWRARPPSLALHPDLVAARLREVAHPAAGGAAH